MNFLLDRLFVYFFQLYFFFNVMSFLLRSILVSKPKLNKSEFTSLLSIGIFAHLFFFKWTNKLSFLENVLWQWSQTIESHSCWRAHENFLFKCDFSWCECKNSLLHKWQIWFFLWLSQYINQINDILYCNNQIYEK